MHAESVLLNKYGVLSLVVEYQLFAIRKRLVVSGLLCNGFLWRRANKALHDYSYESLFYLYGIPDIDFVE